MIGLYVKSIFVKICKSCFTNVCKCVIRHPIVSVISFLLLLLYLFIPIVFVFSIYASPLLVVAAAVYYWFRAKRQDAKRNGIRQEKKIEKKLSTLGKSKSVANDRPMATKPTRSMSQRRNKEKFFVEADPVIAHDVKASISDFLREVRNKRDEELAAKESHQDDGGLCFHTEIRDSKPKLEIDPPLISDRGRDTDGGGGEESGSSEDDKAVVEWNEDDQKNLMDLGISEIERNKRLESLIARRRSRKFYKMNSEKGMIADIDLVGPCTSPSVAATEIVSPASISTRIHDPLLSHASGEDLPGSAPSVLLPGKNPFDLPYDPHEEKPDLMTDSFQQEFAIAPHKEMLMCRHESFTLGHTRAIIHSGNIEEHKPPRHGDPIARTVSVTDLVTDLLEPRQPDESPSKETPVEITTDESTVRTEEKNDQGSEISPNPRPPSLPRPMPKAASVSDLVANDASLSIIHNARVDDHYQNRGTWHTPTNSVASDLQVEVSEVGSPPSTVGGSDSDDDRGSLTYDGDIEKEANSGSEEPLWGLSPHAPRTGKHELALRFLNEASEEGMIESRMANDFKGFDAEIRRNAKQLDKEELISRDSAVEASTTSEDHHKEVLDPLKGEMKKSNDMDGDAGNVDKVEELKSVERQTVHEIGDDISKPVEEIVSEPHLEREFLQGPEKQADVVVKRSEQVDTSSSSTSNLEHRNDDDRGISNDSVVPTPANEASRFITDENDQKISTPSETQSMDDRAIAATSPISVSETLSSLQPEAGMDRQDLTNSDSLQQPGDNVRDENVQQISTPSETQSTNVVVDDRSSSSVPETMSTLQPEVGMDQDLASSNALMSPVSVLVDMSQQEAQMSPSPISQPVHEMDESVHCVDQTPLSHNEQQPSESSTGEIDPSESLVRVNDQDHSQMELPARARDWNDEDHNVDSKGKNSTEITHNDDPGMSHETHVKEEVSKSFEDITYSPEGTTTYGSKSEQEDTRFAEEGNNNSNNVIDERSKEKSSSITKDSVPSEDLLAAKQEVVTELLPKPVDLVPSDGLQGDIIESIRQDAIAEIVKPSDVISEQTIEGESLSSVKREAVEESLKEADMISMEEQPKPVVDSAPLTTVEGNNDSLASIRQQASMELPKTDDLIPSIKPDAIVAESLKEPDSISTKSFLEGGDESMSSMKEAITSMKEQQPKPVADSVPLMTVEGNDSLASIQQEASMEPLKTADFIPSVKQAQLPADSNSISVSSIDEPIQTEVVHTETSVPVAEAEAISRLTKSISPEQDTEHSVSEPVDPFSQIPQDKNDISHNHLQNLDPLASHDQKEDNSQSSNSAINGDQEDEGTSLAANRKDGILIKNSVSDQTTDENIKQHEESDQVAKET